RAGDRARAATGGVRTLRAWDRSGHHRVDRLRGPEVGVVRSVLEVRHDVLLAHEVLARQLRAERSGGPAEDPTGDGCCRRQEVADARVLVGGLLLLRLIPALRGAHEVGCLTLACA